MVIPVKFRRTNNSNTYICMLVVLLRSSHGDIGKVLDNFLGVFCFTSTTFTSGIENYSFTITLDQLSTKNWLVYRL